MLTINRYHRTGPALRGRQRGALTMFSAVLILILLTEMIIYATQTGVFEMRKSGNELRQKQAFHAAEVGIQRAQEYFASNVLSLPSRNDVDGWLSDTSVADGGSGRWVACADVTLDDLSHPCFGEGLDGNLDTASTVTGGTDEPDLRSLSYFYSEDGATPTPIPMPIADGGELLDRDTEAAEVFALLCMLNVVPGAVQPVQGCVAKDDPNFEEVFFVVTLLARGFSECDEDGDCQGEALVAQRMGSYGPSPGSSGPGVPLTSRSNIPPSGTAEIVANPNGGGPGVPVSAWTDGRTGADRCEDDDVPIDPSSGSWSTCEMQEWYGVDIMPDDYTCPTAQCSCGSKERLLSYSQGNDDYVGSDMIVDPAFPCDLFANMFLTEKTDYRDVKYQPGGTVIDDCDGLGPDSRGFIWIEGSVDTCTINANTVVGSPEHPVFLVSAANLTRLNGGATIYGVLMVTDVEGRDGELDVNGNNTVYGAVIVDGELGSYTGTFQVVWNDNLIKLATKRGAIGKLYAGWTDFHEDWR